MTDEEWRAILDAGGDLPTELACFDCKWRPKDATMFRHLAPQATVCPHCGGRLIPAVPIPPEPVKKTSWARVLDDGDG